VINRFGKARSALIGGLGVLTLACPVSAGAAIGVGETFVPSGGAAACGNDRTWLEYPVTADGVISSWSFQADASPPQLKFKLARPTGTPNEFTVVAESAVKTPTAGVLNTYPIQAAAKPGDLIGFYTVTLNDCLRGISTGPPTYERTGEAALNVPAAFTPQTDQLDLSAVLEPTNTFSFAGTTRNKKKGTATLTVNVPNPGELTGSGSGVKVASAGAVISRSVQAGSAHLVIKAKGKKRKKLNATGKVKLNVTITYTPTNGKPATQSTKVKLKKE
jgi:hypothetical protein